MAPSIGNDELSERILAFDNELIDQGFESWQRQLNIESKLSQKLQISYRVSERHEPFHAKPLKQHFATYYRKADLFMHPLHAGAYLFRDLFFPIRILIIFG